MKFKALASNEVVFVQLTKIHNQNFTLLPTRF